ncbi:MAG: right-handed parallel beta-helix repeat-containing protein [Candidatus Pacearchaeota archaeon]
MMLFAKKSFLLITLFFLILGFSFLSYHFFFNKLKLSGEEVFHYVDINNPFCSDDPSNCGTIDRPWCTFERAFNFSTSCFLRGGETLFLREGIYRIDQSKLNIDNGKISGTSDRPTIISAYNKEKVFFYLSEKISEGWIKYCDGIKCNKNIWYFNWTDFVKRSYPGIFESLENRIILDDDKKCDKIPSQGITGVAIPNMVVLDDPIENKPKKILQEINSIKNAYYTWHNWYCHLLPLESIGNDENDLQEFSFYHESNFSSPNFGLLFIYLNESLSPNGLPIEISLDRYIFFKQQNNTLLKDFGVRYANAGDIGTGSPLAFFSNSHNLTFENLDISYNSFAGLANFICFNCKIINCKINYNGGLGSSVVGENTLYENNTFIGNNWRNYSPAFHSGGLKIIPNARSMIFRNNYIAHNLHNGLWIDENQVGGNIIIEKNIFYNNSPRGLYIEISKSPSMNIIRNNILIKNHIQITSSSNNLIINNLIINNSHGIAIYSDVRANSTNNKVYNNIFYNVTYPLSVSFHNERSNHYSILDDNYYDYNLYSTDNSTKIFFGTPQGLKKFEEWKYLSNKDTHSFLENFFMDNKKNDLTFYINSYAIGRGLKLEEIQDDFFGKQRNNFDIGPFSYPCYVEILSPFSSYSSLDLKDYFNNTPSFIIKPSCSLYIINYTVYNKSDIVFSNQVNQYLNVGEEKEITLSNLLKEGDYSLEINFNINGEIFRGKKYFVLDMTPPKLYFNHIESTIQDRQNKIIIAAQYLDMSCVNMTLFLFNSSESLINTKYFPYLCSEIKWTDWIGLPRGLYYINFSATDLAGNKNFSKTIHISLEGGVIDNIENINEILAGGGEVRSGGGGGGVRSTLQLSSNLTNLSNYNTMTNISLSNISLNLSENKTIISNESLIKNDTLSSKDNSNSKSNSLILFFIILIIFLILILSLEIYFLFIKPLKEKKIEEKQEFSQNVIDPNLEQNFNQIENSDINFS